MSYLSIAQLCALSLPAAYQRSGVEAMDEAKTKHKSARSHTASVLMY